MFQYSKKAFVFGLFMLFCLMGFSQEGKIYSNDWEKVKLKGLNLIRLEVPGGWLVREGQGKMAFVAASGAHMMIFMPDPDHQWSISKKKDWQTLKLKGLNLYRLVVPQGWLVREGWGKISSSESETHMISFLSDPEHLWKVAKK